ncbi:MAG: WXG100 family type VII secretion target [Acidimicrobiaceae bacterium]|nr:WXG100 family type VII secretion target [Acidimicrobiaceae bacterium]
MSMIQVNYGAMDAGVQQIRSTFGRLQAMFDDLQSQVNQLSGSWDGASKDAYLSVQQDWNRVSSSLNQALQQMGTGVDTANSNFQQAENANTTGWGR